MAADGIELVESHWRFGALNPLEDDGVNEGVNYLAHASSDKIIGIRSCICATSSFGAKHGPRYSLSTA